MSDFREGEPCPNCDAELVLVCSDCHRNYTWESKDEAKEREDEWIADNCGTEECSDGGEEIAAEKRKE